MTKKELIEKLERFTEDTQVLRVDNSGGYETIYEVKTSPVRETCGEHKQIALAIVLD